MPAGQRFAGITIRLAAFSARAKELAKGLNDGHFQ
jgi:hypothetical protein